MAEGGGGSDEKELVYVISQSDFVFDFFCELCIDDGKHVEAEGFCIDCGEYLCGTCYSGHRMSRPSRHHVLLDKENMPKDMPLSTDRISKEISTKCKCKSGDVVKFYCKSHEFLGCPTCFATVHNTCVERESILDKSETILDSQDYKDFTTVLKYLETKASDIISHSRENQASAKRCCTQTFLAVKKFKEKVFKILNEIEKAFLDKADKMMTEDHDRIEEITKESTEMLKDLQRISADIEHLQSSKRVCQLYIKIQENTSEVTAIKEALRETEKKNTVREYKFAPNNELKSYLGGQNILGTFCQTERKGQMQEDMNEVKVADCKTRQEKESVKTCEKTESGYSLEQSNYCEKQDIFGTVKFNQKGQMQEDTNEVKIADCKTRLERESVETGEKTESGYSVEQSSYCERQYIFGTVKNDQKSQMQEDTNEVEVADSKTQLERESVKTGGKTASGYSIKQSSYRERQDIFGTVKFEQKGQMQEHMNKENVADCETWQERESVKTDGKTASGYSLEQSNYCEKQDIFGTVKFNQKGQMQEDTNEVKIADCKTRLERESVETGEKTESGYSVEQSSYCERQYIFGTVKNDQKSQMQEDTNEVEVADSKTQLERESVKTGGKTASGYSIKQSSYRERQDIFGTVKFEQKGQMQEHMNKENVADCETWQERESVKTDGKTASGYSMKKSSYREEEDMFGIGYRKDSKTMGKARKQKYK